MAITNTAVLATDTTIYTSTNDTAVSVIYFCNTSGATRTLDVHAIPSGGSVAASTQIYDQISIAQNDTFIMETERLILADSDFISAISDSTGVTATVSAVAI
jgi:hypothetical protein